MRLFPRDRILHQRFTFFDDDLFDDIPDETEEQKEARLKAARERREKEEEERRMRREAEVQALKDFWTSILEQVQNDDVAALKLGEALAVIDYNNESAIDCLSHYVDYSCASFEWFTDQLNETLDTKDFTIEPFVPAHREEANKALRGLIDFFKTMGVYDDKGVLLIEETKKKFRPENFTEENSLNWKIEKMNRVITKLSK